MVSSMFMVINMNQTFSTRALSEVHLSWTMLWLLVLPSNDEFIMKFMCPDAAHRRRLTMWHKVELYEGQKYHTSWHEYVETLSLQWIIKLREEYYIFHFGVIDETTWNCLN
jgi:hypothetical protein